MSIGPAAARGSWARRAVAVVLMTGCVAGAGCGEAAVHVHRAAAGITAKRAPARAATGTSGHGSSPAPSQPRAVVARIDASSDAILAEGKVHIAAGAPSDAEIRRELRAARKAGIVLPSGESAASFENAPSTSGAPAVEPETPETSWNPRSKAIAEWIIPILEWAAQHGWSGTVTSGYRTYYEQAQLNAAGAFSAPAGLSNHESTVYPGGAVDVTSPSQLITVLRGYSGPVKLVGGVLGAVDPEHFSATGD
jgi:hypothetical protein